MATLHNCDYTIMKKVGRDNKVADAPFRQHEDFVTYYSLSIPIISLLTNLRKKKSPYRGFKTL